MSKQHCIHLSALTLRIDEATIQVILSRYWLRNGTGTSDVTSVCIRGLLHVKFASRDLSHARIFTRGRVRLVDPRNWNPLGSSSQLLERILQKANGIIDVVVYDREVEQMAIFLAKVIRLFSQLLETFILQQRALQVKGAASRNFEKFKQQELTLN